VDPGFEAAFRHFVADRSGALFRTAYLLTGDRHAAEDLVQSAVAALAVGSTVVVQEMSSRTPVMSPGHRTPSRTWPPSADRPSP
jgi:hypothetical protein